MWRSGLDSENRRGKWETDIGFNQTDQRGASGGSEPSNELIQPFEWKDGGDDRPDTEA